MRKSTDKNWVWLNKARKKKKVEKKEDWKSFFSLVAVLLLDDELCLIKTKTWKLSMMKATELKNLIENYRLWRLAEELPAKKKRDFVWLCENQKEKWGKKQNLNQSFLYW